MCLRPILVSVLIGAALWALVIWAALSASRRLCTDCGATELDAAFPPKVRGQPKPTRCRDCLAALSEARHPGPLTGAHTCIGAGRSPGAIKVRAGSDRLAGREASAMSAEPELQSRLLAVGRAIDDALVASHALRAALKPGHPVRRTAGRRRAPLRRGAVFALWAELRAERAVAGLDGEGVPRGRGAGDRGGGRSARSPRNWRADRDGPTCPRLFAHREGNALLG